MSRQGKVWLVGAGPGDVGLFTMKGAQVLEQADVVVYDSLVGQGILTRIPASAKLINVGKARGRMKSLDALVEHMAETAVEPANQTIFISHGDSLEDAQYVERQVRERFQVKDIYINYIDPVIGAHSGPGTIALFFLGTHR